jgi:hypothetical protein
LGALELLEGQNAGDAEVRMPSVEEICTRIAEDFKQFRMEVEDGYAALVLPSIEREGSAAGGRSSSKRSVVRLTD